MNLRTVLAGPILRRAERGGVYIWLATSRPFYVKGEVFRVPGDFKRRLEKVGSGGAQSVQLGEQLFITLVRVAPMSGLFPADVLLAYDLELCHHAAERYGLRLHDLGLLHGPDRLTYDDLPLPSFFLRETLPLQFLHGSCRKLHGDGDDCLTVADDALALTARDLSRRPSALFLTGDQIYADDVSADLLPCLTELGMTITGREEPIPGIDVPWQDIPVGGRGELVREKAHFTSSKADQHLMSFGEYAAMYLLAWSPDHWPAKIPSRDLRLTRDGLAAVRRALANIPTYMLFDDHEITDDWNLSGKWRDDVFESPAGRRIIANGLAAYWAFQGWGNDPERYDASFIRTLQDHLAGDPDRNADRAADQFEKQLWLWPDWSYAIPVSPLTLAVDTRTQRQYDTLHDPGRLLSENALVRLKELTLQNGYQPGDPLTIISPTPVFGYEEIEIYLQDNGRALVGPYVPDAEAWHSNPDGWVALMSSLAGEWAPSRVLFLSGDVHYAYSVRAMYHESEHPPLPVVQLTSSALKNSSEFKKIIELSSRVAKFLKGTSRRVGWKPDGDRRMFARFPVLGALAELLPDLPPDFEVWREYVPTLGYSTTPIQGANNLGLVQLSLDGREIEHHLLIRKNEEIFVTTALIENDGKW